MKIFKISQNINNDYDTYSDAVVVAVDEEDARKIHPNGEEVDDAKEPPKYPYGTWCQKIQVTVELIGTAKAGTKRGVICASFHAG